MQFKLFPQTKDFPYIDSGLSGRVNDLFTRLDQMTSLVETHEAVSQRLTAQLETLNHEFRGVLQTVDDQVILYFYQGKSGLIQHSFLRQQKIKSFQKRRGWDEYHSSFFAAFIFLDFRPSGLPTGLSKYQI